MSRIAPPAATTARPEYIPQVPPPIPFRRQRPESTSSYGVDDPGSAFRLPSKFAGNPVLLSRAGENRDEGEEVGDYIKKVESEVKRARGEIRYHRSRFLEILAKSDILEGTPLQPDDFDLSKFDELAASLNRADDLLVEARMAFDKGDLILAKGKARNALGLVRDAEEGIYDTALQVALRPSPRVLVIRYCNPSERIEAGGKALKEGIDIAGKSCIAVSAGNYIWASLPQKAGQEEYKPCNPLEMSQATTEALSAAPPIDTLGKACFVNPQGSYEWKAANPLSEGVCDKHVRKEVASECNEKCGKIPNRESRGMCIADYMFK